VIATWVMCSMALAQSAGGCSKDTDCKGDRICEAGRCVSPTPPAPPLEAVDAGVSSPPLPPPTPVPLRKTPDEYPKVVRRRGAVCVQSLTDEGVVREDCRDEREVRRPARSSSSASDDEPPPSRRPRLEREADEPPRSSFVADFGVTGSLTILPVGVTVVFPGFGLHLALGGRVSDAVGVVGLLDFNLAAGFGTTLINVTLAPGLRLGDGGHATIALGPTLLAFSGAGTGLTGLAATLLVRGVFIIAGGFGVHTQAALTFDATAAFFTLGLGFGGSSF